MTDTDFVSPKLLAPLRTEAEAKRQRHAKRLHGLFLNMTAGGVLPMELKAAMAECVEFAHFDQSLRRSDVSRIMFSDLRSNLRVAKGDWRIALSYMDDDAYSERCRQGYDDLEAFSYDVDMQREMRAG